MKLATNIAAIRDLVAELKAKGQKVALVPTMGNLHKGHESLIKTAREHADAVVVSIFVNPLQFGENEDLADYPRTLETDKQVLESLGVEVLFLPDELVMYPKGLEKQTRVYVPRLNRILCGVTRPVHFEGVTTVVARLFNLVQADIAVFGKKDYQQLISIKRMVEDLAMPVEVVGVETHRASSGLALSSRNHYLSEEQKDISPLLFQTLKESAELVSMGRQVTEVEQLGQNKLTQAGFQPEYLSVRRQSDLAVAQQDDKNLVILAAAWLGHTRLIDNLEFVRS